MRIGIITGKDDEISLDKEINKLNIKDREKMNIRIQKINKEYENLSKLYQKNKKNNLIPLN